MEKVFNKIIKWSIYLLTFLMPIFFLPFTYEAFEFNKQYLLVFLVSTGVLAWLAKMVIVRKEFKFKWLPLNIPILAFLLVSILSTVFSIDKLTSVFGFYGRFSGSLIEIITLVLFYFLVINNVKTGETIGGEENKGEAKIPGIINGFLWSTLGVVILSLFSAFGFWNLLEYLISKTDAHLPAIFSRIFNPVSGSPAGLAIFLAIALVFISALFFQKQNSGKKIVLLSFITFSSVILMILIDFIPAWIILGLSSLALFIFALWSKIFRDRINWLLLPIFLCAISIVFFFVQTSNLLGVKILGFNIMAQPQEVILNQSATWKTAINTAKVYPVLGSGLSTFSQDFSKLKPQDFNKSAFWQIRFDRGTSYVAEIVMTMGILGFLAWLVMMAIALLSCYSLIIKIKQAGTESNYQVLLLFVFIALFIGQLVYYQNITLSFLFWLIIGLAVVSFSSRLEKIFSFSQFPELGLIFGIFLIVIGLSIFGIWFFAGKFYFADIQYKNGVASSKTELLERAISLNGFRPGYRIVLSRTYFTDAIKAVGQQNVQTAQNYFAKSVDQAKKAIAMSPNWVVGFENLGMVYRDLRGYIKDVSSFSIDAFNNAEKLEPYNPVLVVEVGKIYRDDKNYSKAEAEFNKALSLKPDYSDAGIQLALTLAAEGNTNDAIAKLKEVVQANSTNVEGYLQLGILYYNNNQFDEAILGLQQALKFSPNNANALYILGLSYNKKGDKDNALEAFNKVLELNPGNQDVLNKISEIQGTAPKK